MNYGIDKNTFWESSVYEIGRLFEAIVKKKQEEQKEKIAINYSLARNIANFVALAFNGKEIPNIYDTYPGVFDEYTPDTPEGSPKPWEFYKE